MIRIALLSSPILFLFFFLFFYELDVHDWNGHDGADIPELVVVFVYMDRLLNDFNTHNVICRISVNPSQCYRRIYELSAGEFRTDTQLMDWISNAQPYNRLSSLPKHLINQL
jgi:hypothetical protein